MDSKKIEKGNKKIKQLDGGIHTNLELLRISLNKICDAKEMDKPEELQRLNTLFDE